MSVEIATLNDEELRVELTKNGINAGPIGPSTRKVYELKLLKVLENSNKSVLNNSSVRRSATPEVFSNGQNGARHGSPASFLNGSSNKVVNDINEDVHASTHATHNSQTISESDHENDQQNSDEDEEENDQFEESFRRLSPEEAFRFRSNFSNSFYSENMASLSKPQRNSTLKTVLVALALLGIVVFSLTIITQISVGRSKMDEDDDL